MSLGGNNYVTAGNFLWRISDEGLALLIISLIGCLVTPLGILIAPIVLKRNKATNTFHRGVIMASVVCFLVLKPVHCWNKLDYF